MPASNTPFSSLLPLALPFLRAEPHLVDPNLPHMVSAITSVGAGECWHKDNCFLGHLLDVYRILKLWGAPDPVARCGLFHSVYSNSYVDLAIFDPANGGRELLRSIAGDEAERLVHLFCIVPRQSLIHDDLLFQYTELELVEHLTESEESVRRARDEGVVDEREPWRRKMVAVLPEGGVTVKHINTGEDVALSRRMVATFLLMTMADFCDQLYAFQDELFDNTDGQMNFSGNTFTALWPGDGRPGLWMNSLSRMAALYNLILREESLYLQSRKASIPIQSERDEALELIVPPVFSNCTKILGRESQLLARDLYWKAMAGPANKDMAAAESLLKECCKENGYVAEPHLVLGQVYMAVERYEEAEREAEEGLRLLLEWGSPWDKRMSWEGWVAWGRLLLQKAKARSWPKTSFGIISLGLVR
ncbi:uncharacterized protein LOC110112200 [Dendrobium catenatum]|uniref:DUF6817 domain-containing protein n=1 Tax=Dendrobium catenatum TaxID=906689 RepID=A0A2I0XB16_9ASPA|nr:uncharacterized protein LOC110112200 [Dendrobium catenatum]PKU85103.1 hypothetical protein MA16_Dca018217 [Dendrobium catenatum]